MSSRENYIKNRDRVLAKSKAYYRDNRERILALHKEKYRKWRIEHPRRQKVYKGPWWKRNRDTVNSLNRKRSKTPRGRFNTYQAGARRRGINFLLTFEEFMTFWQSPCHFCGASIETIGLDRINGRDCYSIGNVHSCCGRCNTMKMSDTDEEFIARCKLIASRF